jgi:hypothetical protein
VFAVPSFQRAGAVGAVEGLIMAEVSEFVASEQTETRVDDYRALSVLSIICLVAGILSLAAMAHPIFWFFPVVAVLTGATAIRHIRRSEGELTGEAAATAGITLGMVFFLAGLGTFLVLRWQGKREATNLGYRFLQYLQVGDTSRAANLMEPVGFRLPENANFAEIIATDHKAQKQIESFVGTEPVVKVLARLGVQCEISLYDVEAFGTIEGEPGAYLVYKLDYAGQEDQRNQLLVMLHCAYRRNVHKLSEGGWYVRKISGPPYNPRSARVREAAVHDHAAGGDDHDH